MSQPTIEEAMASEINRLRAILEEWRQFIRKLLADRDQHVAVILQARTALEGLIEAADAIDKDKIGPVGDLRDVSVSKSFIKGLANKIAAASNPPPTTNGGS